MRLPAASNHPAPGSGGAARLLEPSLKAPSQTFSVHIVQTHEQNGVNGPDRSSMNRFGLAASLIVFFYYERTEAEFFFFLLLCSDDEERLHEGEVPNPQTPFSRHVWVQVACKSAVRMRNKAATQPLPPSPARPNAFTGNISR